MDNKEIKLLRERMKREDPKLFVLMEKCFDAGVLAGKEQAKQKPWRESASDYERGVVDGRQMQVQSSVDKAVNRMAQRKPLTDEQIDDLSRTMVKGNKSVNWLCREIEAAHNIKEKNT